MKQEIVSELKKEQVPRRAFTHIEPLWVIAILATLLLPALSESTEKAENKSADVPSSLENGFINPPPQVRLRAYWWWLNGNVTKASITRDLEQMKAKGFGGALIFDADGSAQQGNDRALTSVRSVK